MTYALLLLTALCLELALNLPVGSLPLALEHDGATREQIAMSMGAGMFTFLIVSIPIGALVDRIGRIATMRMGIALAFISMAALYSTHGPVLGAALMACRAMALCGFMTAQFAYGSMIVPKDRSVSAVATMGIIGNFCFALAPALGVYLWQSGCGREQYLWAEVLIVIGAFLLTRCRKARYENYSIIETTDHAKKNLDASYFVRPRLRVARWCQRLSRGSHFPRSRHR